MKALTYGILIFALAALSAHSLPIEDLLPFDSDQEMCLSKLNLDRYKIGYINAQLYPEETDADFNEFTSCAWKRRGYQHANGQINFKNVQEFFKEFLEYQAEGNEEMVGLARKMARVATRSCKHVKGVSHGQTAVKVQNCIFRRLQRLAQEYNVH